MRNDDLFPRWFIENPVQQHRNTTFTLLIYNIHGLAVEDHVKSTENGKCLLFQCTLLYYTVQLIFTTFICTVCQALTNGAG